MTMSQKLKQPRKRQRLRHGGERVVRAQMKIHKDGTASFHVRGYDFRWADMPIAVNGYLFAPVRPNTQAEPLPPDGERGRTQDHE